MVAYNMVDLVKIQFVKLHGIIVNGYVCVDLIFITTDRNGYSITTRTGLISAVLLVDHIVVTSIGSKGNRVTRNGSGQTLIRTGWSNGADNQIRTGNRNTHAHAAYIDTVALGIQEVNIIGGFCFAVHTAVNPC